MTVTSEGVGRVLPLTLGWEHLPKTVSVLGADPSVRLREPVTAVLCEVEDGWVLLDCGFNTPTVRDPALRRRFHGGDHIVPELPAATEPNVDPLIAAFALVGVDPADVVAVALSHLHTDHAGGLRHFAGLVPVHIQRAELDHGFGEHPGPERQGILRIDFDDPLIDWRLADGPVDIVPGLRAIPTVGHTPGHQSFMVSLAVGGGFFIFTFDAADLTENLDDEVSVGGLYGGTDEDSVAAIRQLKTLAADTGYRLVPGHDPVAWPALCADLGVPTFIWSEPAPGRPARSRGGAGEAPRAHARTPGAAHWYSHLRPAIVIQPGRMTGFTDDRAPLDPLDLLGGAPVRWPSWM